MPRNKGKGKDQSKSAVNTTKNNKPLANDKTGAKSEVKNKTKSEPVEKNKAKPEPDEKSKSMLGNAMSSAIGYMRETFSSKAKSVDKDIEKKQANLADFSDDEDEGVMDKTYHNSGGSSSGRTDYESSSHTSRVAPRESTIPRDSVTSGASKSYAQVTRTGDKKPHFSDSPQNSISSRASAGGFHPNQDISGLVEQTALRRISSAGRTTEIGNYKPAEPLTVDRHNKIKLGSRVMVRGFMEKGVVRWLGMFDGGECIAGLEMERSNAIYNSRYDDKRWFHGPVLREHYVDCDHLQIMEPETKTPESYEKSMYRNLHPASVANNYSQFVELEDTSDGRIRVGMRARIKYTDHIGTVRWIGLSSRDEWVGLEMDERSSGNGNLCGDTWFECDPARAEYAMASRVEPLPYENFPSSPRPSVHRDDFNANRHTQSYSSADYNSHVRATPPKALFIVVEKEKHGDYKLDDIVKYTAHDSGSVPKPGQIRFIGRVKDDRNGTVYVGLDMYDFAYNRDDHTFDDFPQFEAENMKPGCALYCDIRDISPLEDERMDTGAEDARRQERKGSDSRLQRHTVNTDTIKEEPSSGDISPELDDDVDLYGDGTSSKITPCYTRHTPDKRESHQRGDDAIDMKAARKSDPLSNGNSYNTRDRNGGNTTYTSSMEWKNREEKGPELKKPPLKDLSLVKRVSQYEGLEVDAMVQTTGKKVVYGVIRWMGYLPGRQDLTEPPLVGIETEEYSGDADRNNSPNMQRHGVYDGYPLFECKSGRGAFFNAKRLLRDQRFEEVETEDAVRKKYEMEESVVIPGNQIVIPYTEAVLGRFKGIQGHHNSCYLDSTLYSMFAFTQVFDSILHRPKQVGDIPEYNRVQEILREKIVNPLRRNHYVDAGKVLELRQLLDRLTSVKGMMGEEKDPEEFINSLLLETMRAEPFIKLSSGQASFMYQLFIEKDEKKSRDPTVQEILKLSFEHSNVKLKEVPPCLILQMPRFGRSYKMFDRIIPSPNLDITDILEPTPHTCSACSKKDLSHWFVCDDCMTEHFPVIQAVEFCRGCFREHQKSKRSENHIGRAVHQAQHDKHTMELFSVVCIETSHYVSFTKCLQTGNWVFFDSMADRIGDLHGFNIPEVSDCFDIADKSLRYKQPDDPLVKRVLRDAYLCFYRSPVSEMYC